MNKNQKTNENVNYRYPGLLNFEDTETHRELFFGRDQEKEALLDKVLADKLVVLYARSGLGKTSLINAGLKQSLRELGFIPFTVRFDGPPGDPIQKVYADIEETVEQQKSDMEYEVGEKYSLWQYFKTVSFWTKNNNLRKPVLILDQFEEFFDKYLPKERESFIRQLADLVNNTIPEDVKKRTTAGEEEYVFYNEKPPLIKILISIREDYLAHLEEMAGKIPGILHRRYRLLPMDRKNAEEAITGPARKKDKPFYTKPFKYDESAVKQMLDFLGTEVDCSHLQFLCRHLEEKVREKEIIQERESENHREITITVGDLGDETGMQRIMENFYDTQVDKLNSRKKKKETRYLCEKELISKNDRRLTFQEEYIESEFGVSKPLLEELVKLRLLRSESRKQGNLYELSHDTLVRPIRESQKKRSAKKRKAILAVAGIFTLLIFLIVIATMEQTKDEELSKNYLVLAKIHKEQGEIEKAINNYKKAIEKGYRGQDAYVDLAVLFIKDNEPNEAVKLYRQALDTDIKNASIYEEIVRILKEKGMNDHMGRIYDIASNVDSKQSSFYKKLGNEYYRMKTYDKAADMFKKALQGSPKDASLYKRLGDALYQKAVEIDTQHIRAQKYKDAIEPSNSPISPDVKTKSAADYYADAIDAYKKAIDNKPDSHAYRGLGDVFFKQGSLEEAVNAYKKGIEIDPGNLHAHNGLANVFLKQENYEDAAQEYKKALDIDPGFVDALESYEQALQEIKIEKQHRDLTRAFYDRGDELLKQKKYEEAIEAFEKTIEMDPEDPFHASIGLGKALYFNKEYDKAAEIFNKATDHADSWYYLGRIRTQQGKSLEALSAYKQAVERKSDYAEAYYEMGVLYSKRKQYTEAVKAYNKALGLQPGNNDNALKKRIVFTYFLGKEFEKASSLADQLQKEKPLLKKDRLHAIFISAASLLSGGKQAEASRRIKTFIESVKSLPSGYKDEWNNGEIRRSIIESKKLSLEEKHMLQQMLEIFGKSGIERAKKIEALESDFVIYRHITALNKKDSGSYRKLAVLYVKNHKPDKAVDVYRQALKANREYAEIYKDIARTLKIKGRGKYIEQVKRIYRLASGSGSKKASLYFNIGNNYYYLDMFQQAWVNYKKSIEIDPRNARAYYNMGLVLSEQKKYDAVKAAFKKAKNLDYKIAGDKSKEITKKQENYKEAEDDLKKANKKSVNKAETHYKKGYALHRMEKYAEALDAYKKTVVLYPRHHRAYYRMGNVLSHQGKYKDAIEEYRKAIDIDMKGDFVVEAYIELGEALFALGKYKEAIDEYNKAITKNRLLAIKRTLRDIQNEGLAYYNMGRAYLALGEYSNAIDRYKKATNFMFKNASVYNDKGNVFYYQEKYDDAIEEYKKAIKKDPLYASAYHNIGIVLYKQKQYSKAIEKFKKAIEIDPRYMIAYSGMGNAFVKLKEYSKAIEAYKEALDIDPAYVPVRANLVEFYLVSGQFADALESAEEVMKDKKVSPQYQLAMRFISAVSLLFRQNRLEALKQLEELIIYYKSLSKDYDRNWSYSGIKKFLMQTEKASQLKAEKEWLIQLIDILESPKEKGNNIIKKLETSIKATFK